MHHTLNRNRTNVRCTPRAAAGALSRLLASPPSFVLQFTLWFALSFVLQFAVWFALWFAVWFVLQFAVWFVLQFARTINFKER